MLSAIYLKHPRLINYKHFTLGKAHKFSSYKNNKLTALSPVYKVHTHLSLIQAQVYIYGIALQTVQVIESTATKHKASYSQTRHH